MIISKANQNFCIVILLGTFLCSFAACEKDQKIVHFPNAYANNIDDQLLYEAIRKAESDRGILSLIVSRNGVIIAEKYFGNNGPDSVHPTKSVTKSVTSILFGIAINNGFINNIDETVGDYLSKYLTSEDTAIAKVSIRELLSMTAGFEWDELTDPDWIYWNNWVRSDDHFLYALHVPLIHEPGTCFTYCTSGCQILSGIFTEATGYTLKAFGEEFLFIPLGIVGDRYWGSDQHGFNYGGVSLSLKASDMVKIGELYLNNGFYNGQQVVSEEWVKTSTFPYVNTYSTMPSADQYGYLWWMGERQGISYFFANGYGGQFIFVFPDLNLVVTAQSEINNAYHLPGQQWANTISIILDDVLASVN